MTRITRVISVVLLAIAIVAGAIADRPPARPAVVLGGYRVLAVDFHTHDSLGSNGLLTPWGLVLEARRQGLDAIAITGHNEVVDGWIGRWFQRLVGGPIVLAGEEIVSPTYHLIAAGISHKVSFRQPAAEAIANVHRQGGVAIAAHPVRDFWPGYDAAATGELDGSEVCHPIEDSRPGAREDLERFFARAPMAAIGSSDFHGIGAMGSCRTYVFARANDAGAILEAVRAHRTVVYGRDGRAYGEPALVALAGSDPALRASALADSRGGTLDWISRIAGILGLAGLVGFGVARAGTAR